MKKILIVIVGVFAITPNIVLAHCPLCTIGAGALAIFAMSIGVSSAIIGIFIGAFALALGLWTGNVIKRQYIPFQKTIIAMLIYLSTIIPLMSLAKDYYPVYVSIFGKYGSLLHNTYIINLFILGAVLGAMAVFVAKPLSKWISNINGGKLLVRYQGPILSFILLVIVSIIVQLLL